MNFNDLNLHEKLLKAVTEEGYETPSPIQEQAIPPVLAGRDVLGCAQTGTGKTAAFALPILHNLLIHREDAVKASGDKNHWVPRTIKCLVLTPTRELATQIAQSFNDYGRYSNLKSTTVFGGVTVSRQITALRNGIDILIATPGRLKDLMNQGEVDLTHLETFVLDEADRMLDMGFINDVKQIISRLPVKRQTLFFSATMPSEITKLISEILTNPVRIEVTPVSSTVEVINQSIYLVDSGNKPALLAHILEDTSIISALVFTRTKHGADNLVKFLLKNDINAQAIHGNKSQNARQFALENFKTGQTRILVATDIAARGIDIDNLSHVINYELPNIPESYVHRIGRTGRAGLSGTAISFCNFDEKAYLIDIQNLIGKKIPVVNENPFPMLIFTPAPPKERGRRGSFSSNSNHSSGNARSNGNARSSENARSSGGASSYKKAKDFKQTKEFKDGPDKNGNPKSESSYTKAKPTHKKDGAVYNRSAIRSLTKGTSAAKKRNHATPNAKPIATGKPKPTRKGK